MWTRGPSLIGAANAPLNITNLFGASSGLWLDYTDGTTVFSDTFGTVPATPGSVAKSIRSKSPEASLLATNPYLDWPWTVDGNGVVSAALDGTRTWMIGYGLPLISDNGGAWTQVALFTAASSTLGSIVDSDLVLTRTFQGLIVSSAISYFQLFGPANAVGDVLGVGTTGLNVPRVVSARISQPATSIRQDRVQVNSGALTHALPTGYSANLTIGAAVLSGTSPPYNRYNGRIYCLMMINRYLSDSEVLAVETEMLRVAKLL